MTKVSGRCFECLYLCDDVCSEKHKHDSVVYTHMCVLYSLSIIHYVLLLLCKGVMPPEAEYCIVERLFISSLVAFVTKDHRRKLFVYHFKKGTEICHYTYNDTILAVKLNRQVSDAFV